MIFCSGASQIPPSGFDGYPSITFEREGILAASTCALQLRLPVSHGDRYIDFKEAMILSLKGMMALVESKLPSFFITVKQFHFWQNDYELILFSCYILVKTFFFKISVIE